MQQKNKITLKGSTQIVTEFFDYSVNSILYQRGIYPPEEFERVSKYGCPLMVTTDSGLKGYIKNVLAQLSEWLLSGNVQKLVLVLTDAQTSAVLERWTFDIIHEKPVEGQQPKAESEILKEIQAIIRQITASVTFLPIIEGPCLFELLVQTDSDLFVPTQWEESDPKLIVNSSQVRLRSFTTSIHRVESMVAYKAVF